MNPLRRLIIPGLILLIVVTFAVLGYQYLEGWSFIDALYMVVITLSTVGFREVHDLNTAGRVLTIGVIIVGIATVAYTVGQLIEMMVEGHIVGYRRRKKMKQRITELKDHYIICGFGRVGHQVVLDLKAAKIPYVVIDSKADTVEELEPLGIPHLIGDITSDAILEEAGVKRAKGLIASADSDAANVFVVLSARVLNPKLFIIARASSLHVEEKLKKAGANRVISPYYFAGKRMAEIAIKPTAVDFIDSVLHGEHVQMEMREFNVDGNGSIINKTLAEAQIRQKTGSHVIAIKKANGKFNLQPVAESKIESGDTLVAIGTPKQVDSLERMVS